MSPVRILYITVYVAATTKTFLSEFSELRKIHYGFNKI